MEDSGNIGKQLNSPLSLTFYKAEDRVHEAVLSSTMSTGPAHRGSYATDLARHSFKGDLTEGKSPIMAALRRPPLSLLQVAFRHIGQIEHVDHNTLSLSHGFNG